MEVCLVLILPVIALTIQQSTTDRVYLLSLIVSGLFVSTLDLFFVASFSLHMAAMSKEMNETNIDPKLTIISKYGMQSTVFAILAALCLLTCLVAEYVDPEGNQVQFVRVYLVAWALKDVLLSCIGCTLLGMRVELTKCDNLRVATGVSRTSEQKLRKIDHTAVVVNAVVK
ncbi:hypothetical protein HDU98_006691 [Podochytrium sp. JEL0797]|nr:hypothetical protein HDU98_006691 [Podochytrium sp. JEL0797]